MSAVPRVLPETDRDRLAKLLGLLGSAYDGEVAAAGRLADTLVRSAGLTWAAVLAPPLLPPTGPEPTADLLRGDWRTMAASCSRFPRFLDKWELQFLSGIWPLRQLSTKQRAILIRIVTRLRAGGCAL